MPRHERGGERGRTGARSPPAGPDVAEYAAHYATLARYSDELRERRCRGTRHFDDGLEETAGVFRPLFARWNVEVLFHVHVRGPRRFGELKRALGGVSSRVLTDKLRHLESEGFLVREEGRYALTGRGVVVARHLHPLLFYLHNEDAVRAFARPEVPGGPGPLAETL